MKTSWTETEQIEAHISGSADAGNVLLFEAKLLLDPTLTDKVLWQQKTYNIIKDYGRRQLKTEIEAIHHELFTRPEHRSFSRRIGKLFFKP